MVSSLSRSASRDSRFSETRARKASTGSGSPLTPLEMTWARYLEFLVKRATA